MTTLDTRHAARLTERAATTWPGSTVIWARDPDGDLALAAAWVTRGWYLRRPDVGIDWLAADPAGASLALSRRIRDAEDPGWRRRGRQRAREAAERLGGVAVEGIVGVLLRVLLGMPRR